MSKQLRSLLKKSTEVTVIAQAQDNRLDAVVWLAAAFACAVYLFSFFFSFSQERAPA